GYEEKTADLLNRQMTYEDWSSGWMVNLPTSVDSVKEHQNNTLVIPDPQNPGEIMAFLEYLLLGQGIDAKDLQERFLSMPDDKIYGDYRERINLFKQGVDLEKVAWIEMSAVDALKQEKSECVGIAE